MTNGNVINSDASIMGIRNSFGRMETAEVVPQEETVRSMHIDEKQPKKRKTLRDEPDMRWNAGIRKLWAAELSLLVRENYYFL